MYMVFNIGCIECGVSSKIVGLFADKSKAEEIRNRCSEEHYWREHGQNHFEIFELPEPEVIDPEYLGKPQKQPTSEERAEMLKAARKTIQEWAQREMQND